MKIVGVDLGRKGALAELDTDTDSLAVYDMPIDSDGRIEARVLFDRWLEFSPSLAVIEAVWRPNSLVRQAGAVEAICGVLQCDCRRVAAVQWKTKMLGVNSSDKQRSVRVCQQLRPDANLMISPRHRVPSPDRAEAILLALYARDHLLN